MALDLKPVDYLVMLKEEHQEYRHTPVFVRKAIICCALSNAMPEIIFAEYGSTEPHRVHGVKSHGEYREHLRGECEAHHTVRDICDFSKHGPSLSRTSVSVKGTTLIGRSGRIIQGMLGATTHYKRAKLWITHTDGQTQLMADVLEQVIASWDVIFPRDGL